MINVIRFPKLIGEVGRWFGVSCRSDGLSPDRFPGRVHCFRLAVALVSPAAPDRTVHAVLRHTALRHRSSQRMRGRVAHRSGESVDTEVAQP